MDARGRADRANCPRWVANHSKCEVGTIFGAGGVPRQERYVNIRTGQRGFEIRLSNQLKYNGLGGEGFSGDPVSRGIIP
jgi:hypothetical protein